MDVSSHESLPAEPGQTSNRQATWQMNQVMAEWNNKWRDEAGEAVVDFRYAVTGKLTYCGWQR